MLDSMALRSLTYVSQAALQLSEMDLDAIHRAAIRLNVFDGITGLLIYNGRSFLQTIEGPSEGIDDLMARLHADPRHFAIDVIDDRAVTTRSFPGWRLELMRMSAGRFEGQDELVLPSRADPRIAALIAETAAQL